MAEEVRPLASQPKDDDGEISITPVRRRVQVANLDDLFAEYDGAYRPVEDGFAKPYGSEEQ